MLVSGCGQPGKDVSQPANSSSNSPVPSVSEVSKSQGEKTPDVQPQPGQSSSEASSISPSTSSSAPSDANSSQTPLVGPGPSLFQEGTVQPGTHTLVLDAQTTGPISFPLTQPTAGDVLYAMTCSARTSVAVTRFPAGQPIALDSGGQCVPGRVFTTALTLPETTTRLDVVMSPESVVHVSVFVRNM